MKLQGSLEIKSVTTAGLRVNEGLNASYITENVQLNKYSKKYQHYKTTSDRIVTLPEEETIPVGWSVVIFNYKDSSANIKTQSVSGEFYKILKPSKTVTYVLVSKDAGNIIWGVVESGGGDGSKVTFRTWDDSGDVEISPDIPEEPPQEEEPVIPEPEPTYANISFVTLPADAEVAVRVGADGNYTILQEKSITVKVGETLYYSVSKDHYVQKDGSILVEETTVLNIVLYKEQVVITANLTPTDANIIWNLPDGSTETTNHIIVDRDSTVTYSASKDGYKTVTGSVVCDLAKDVDIVLPVIPTYTLTINTTPAEANVIITNVYGESVSTSSIDGLEGSSFSYTVTCDGYETVEGNVTLTENKTIDIVMTVVDSGDTEEGGSETPTPPIGGDPIINDVSVITNSLNVGDSFTLWDWYTRGVNTESYYTTVAFPSSGYLYGMGIDESDNYEFGVETLYKIYRITGAPGISEGGSGYPKSYYLPTNLLDGDYPGHVYDTYSEHVGTTFKVIEYGFWSSDTDSTSYIRTVGTSPKAGDLMLDGTYDGMSIVKIDGDKLYPSQWNIDNERPYLYRGKGIRFVSN